MKWNERALVGVKRFLDRFYGFVTEKAGRFETTDRKSEVLINRVVKSIGEDYSEFKFNTAVAKLMEALNELQKEDVEVSNGDLGKLIKTLAPLAPFISEELWSQINGDFSIHTQEWPEFNEKLLMSESVSISVQINGKVRGVIEINPNAEESEARDIAEKNDNVKKYLLAGKIIKVVYIKGRTISFVVAFDK
jgi:leucyl-tRNA synthetase